MGLLTASLMLPEAKGQDQDEACKSVEYRFPHHSEGSTSDVSLISSASTELVDAVRKRLAPKSAPLNQIQAVRRLDQ